MEVVNNNKLKYMNKYLLPIVIILTIGLATVILVSGNSSFKQNAGKLASKQDIDSVFLDTELVDNSSDEYFLLSLDNSILIDNLKFSGTLSAGIESLSDKAVLKELKSVKGKILISGNPSVTSRAWIILSQLGFSNIFILTSDSKPEVLKYEFRSDTLVRPEF